MGGLKSLVPRPVKRWVRSQAERVSPPIPQYARASFAQEGEDLVIARLTNAEQLSAPGFYVDVGAHHPSLYSNTLFFYQRGWSGINIDAMPGSMAAFATARPRDINIEAAISERPAELTYYEFNEPALNGFDAHLAQSRIEHSNYRVVNQRQIRTRTLNEILAERMPPGRTIDFLTVDVEGLDLSVLKSNDWTTYRPRLVLAEDANVHWLEQIGESELVQFMHSIGYRVCAKTALTLFFADREHLVVGPTGPRVTIGPVGR